MSSASEKQIIPLRFELVFLQSCVDVLAVVDVLSFSIALS
jgi:hypothetical protein